jgi:hypothetical protein
VTRLALWATVGGATVGGATVGSLGLAFAAGCVPSNAALRAIAQDEQIPLGSAKQAGEWPFWPNSVRFLPLCRSVSSASIGGRSLELFVECLDVDGHNTKASGHLVLELTCSGAVPPSRRLTLDLTDPITNRTLWDPVTASYRLDVPAPFDTPPESGSDIDCRIILFAVDGSTPTATIRVSW